ncbi:TPA: SigB/SigF/SigG family RNA polymerase sigma factor [bacterium]|nr:SigB/SigF/SigG family RNA polymerase sigma factor [bacterium]
MARHKVVITGVETSNIKVLKNEETIQLIKRLQAGDASVQNEIVNGNLKLILSVIKKFSNRTDNLDDLFQIGCIGLIKAINNFDLSYNLRFSTYAVPMIIGEIKRYLRDNTPVRISRQIKDLAYKSMKVKEEYIMKYHNEPSEEQIAEILEVDVKSIQEALSSTQSVVSLYDPIYGEGDDAIYLIDQLGDDYYSNEKLVNYITLRNAIKRLNEQQRTIIKDRYYLGKTQFEIASEFNISQAQVSRLEKSAIESLRSYF